MKSFSTCKKVILVLGFCCIFLPSCAARINGSLAADGSASLQVNMSLQPRMTALVQRMFAAGGQEGQVLDAPAIADSMSVRGTSVTLRNTGPAAVEGQMRISHIGDFLSAADDRGGSVFEQNAGKGRLEININLNNGSEFLELLSPQITDYLNALMAPVATGEQLTKDEYLELVASFYNKPISDEIAVSRITASIDFPGTVTGVKGGTFSGRRVNFNIPLLDLLVLETPLVYEVTWNIP